MQLNPFLLQAAKLTIQKQAFVQPQGQQPDPTAAQPPPGGAAPGQAVQDPSAPPVGQPGGGPDPQASPMGAPMPPTDTAGAAMPPTGAGLDPNIMTMINQAVQQAMGGAGGPKKGGGSGGKNDELAHQLHQIAKIQIAMANQMGLQLPNETMLSPPPGTDMTGATAQQMAQLGGGDPNAGGAAQPGAEQGVAPEPPPTQQPTNFVPGLVPKMASEIAELASRIGTPIAMIHEPQVIIQVPIPAFMESAFQKESSSLVPPLEQTRQRAEALQYLMSAERRR